MIHSGTRIGELLPTRIKTYNNDEDSFIGDIESLCKDIENHDFDNDVNHHIDNSTEGRASNVSLIFVQYESDKSPDEDEIVKKFKKKDFVMRK